MGDAMRGYEPDVAMLRSALRELLEATDYIEDIQWTRDLEPYKSEAIWDAALVNARKALRETT
jgi:hypothetical protein